MRMMMVKAKMAAQTMNEGVEPALRGSVSHDTDVVCVDIEQGFRYQASMAEASWAVAAHLGLLDGAISYPVLPPSCFQGREESWTHWM